MVSVLFVCMANVCRSPMALAVARSWQEKEPNARALIFAAAGTSVGRGRQPIDARARAALQRRGYQPARERSRQVTVADLAKADYVLAMDGSCLQSLLKICPAAERSKLTLFLDVSRDFAGQDVPDPYFGPTAGFERVLDLCEIGIRALITQTGTEPPWEPRLPLATPS
jgi:protein-tyrosine phosphatase